MEFHQQHSMSSLPSIADFNEPISEADEIESVRALQQQGDAAITAKDYAGAAACYGEALEIDSENPQLLARRAMCNIELKEYTKVEEDARALIKLNPHVPQGHYLLAVALDNLKEYNQAIVSFLHALRYDIKHRDQLADNVAVVASNICHYSEETLQQFEAMSPVQKLMTVGEALKTGDENAVCIEVLQTAIDLQPLENNQPLRALFLIAESHLTLVELDQSREKYKQCLALALQCTDQQYEAKCYRRLAELSLRHNDLEQGIVYYEKLLSICDDLVAKHGQEKLDGIVGCELHKMVHETLCGAYRSMGDLPHALQHAKQHLESVAMDDDGNYKQLLGNGHFTVASLQEAVGDYTAALDHYQAYFTATKSQKDRIGMGWSYGCLGRVYHCLFNYSLAQSYYEQQLHIADSLGHLSMHAAALRSLGDLANDMHKFEEALEHLHSYLRVSRKLDEFETECKAYLRLGEVHQDNANTEHAKYFYEQALNLANRTNQVELAQRSRCKLAYLLVASLDEKEIAKAASLAKTLVSHYEGLLKASDVNSFIKRSEIMAMLSLSYNIVQETLTSLNCSEEALEYTESNNSREICSIVGEQIRRKSQSTTTENPLEDSSITGMAKLVNAINLPVIYYTLTDYSVIIWVLKPGHGCVKMVKSQPSKRNCKEFIKDLIQKLQTGSKSGAVVYMTEYRALPLKDSKTHHLKNKFLSLSTSGRKVTSSSSAGPVVKKEEGKESPSHHVTRQLYDILISPVIDIVRGNAKVVIVPGRDLIQVPFDALEDDTGVCLGEKLTIVILPCLQAQHLALNNETSNDKTAIDETARRADASPIYLDKGLRVTVPPSARPHAVVKDITSEAPKMAQQGKANPTYIAFDTNCYHVKDDIKDPVKEHEKRHVSHMTSKGSTLISETWCGQEVATARQGQIQEYQQAAADGYFAVIGNPYLPEKLQCNGQVWNPNNELPLAQKETYRVAEYLNITAIVGKEATKDRVLLELQRSSLIHLAMFGSWENACLACTPNPTAQPQPNGAFLEEDYMVSANDILGLKLRAQLVVLSCCYGDRHRDMSLTLPLTLLAAGAHNVLILLWAVPDDVQSKFWHHFYKSLASNMTTSQAVSSAKQAVREDERFQDSSLWSPFCLIGQDEMIDVCQVKQAMLDQLVNSTEKTILSSMQKDALNPISTSGKEASQESLVKKLGPHLAGLLLHHHQDKDVLPTVLQIVTDCARLVDEPPSVPPTPFIPRGIVRSPSAIPILNRLGFHFQPQKNVHDAPYVVFPQWDPDDILSHAVQALEGIAGISVDKQCGIFLARVLECQESLISAIIDVLSFTKHMPEIQLRVTDAGVGQLWQHNVARPFLISLGFQHVGSLLMFDGTLANKKLLTAGLQALCALMGEKGAAMLERLDVRYLGMSTKPQGLRSARKTPIKSALRSASTVRTMTPSLRQFTPLPSAPPPTKKLPSLNPVILSKDKVSLSTPWWSQTVNSSEMKEKIKFAKSLSDTHREFNQHVQNAHSWYQNSALRQADDSLSRIGQPKPRPAKIKVKSGATASCAREPVHQEMELSMQAVQQRRDYANFLLQTRKADITWRHEEAVKKLYLPYVQQKSKQTSAI